MSHEENEGQSDYFHVSRLKFDKIEDCLQGLFVSKVQNATVILFKNWYLVDKSKKQEDVHAR